MTCNYTIKETPTKSDPSRRSILANGEVVAIVSGPCAAMIAAAACDGMTAMYYKNVGWIELYQSKLEK